MAGTASISGLSSGLDTATIIDQLMSLESQAQTSLKSSLTTQQRTLKSLQDLNTRIASLATQAGDLRSPATWNALKATSSSTAVSATAAAGATVGGYDLKVSSTSTSAQRTFTDLAAPTDRFSPTSTAFTLTVNGTSTTVDTGTGTLSSLVTALNASGTGVRASTVTKNDGTQRLVVTATGTGAASQFTLTGGDGSAILGGSALSGGTDAVVMIGADTVTSTTNTFTGVLPGVTFTVAPGTAADTAVHLDITSDPSALAGKIKSLVDSVNASLNAIDSLTAYNSDTKTSGPLAGDPATRSLRTSLLETVYPSDGTSLASVGLQTDRTGKLVFDADTFSKAYAADPAAVAAKFTSAGVAGFTSRINAVAVAASDAYKGTLTASVTGRNASIKQTQDDIANWDIRLELKRSSLQRQFTALETAMNQMNSQSNWLAGQINSLSKSS